MFTELGWKSYHICFRILEKLKLDRPYSWDTQQGKLIVHKTKIHPEWVIGNLCLTLNYFCIPTFLFFEHLFDPESSGKRNLSEVHVVILFLVWSLFFHGLPILPLGYSRCATLCSTFNTIVDTTRFVYGILIFF